MGHFVNSDQVALFFNKPISVLSVSFTLHFCIKSSDVEVKTNSLSKLK